MIDGRVHLKNLLFFWFLQIVIICFEMYFIIEMGFSGGWISVCALAILVQTTSIVIIVALSASHVHEEVRLLLLTALSCSIIQPNFVLGVKWI